MSSAARAVATPATAGCTTSEPDRFGGFRMARPPGRGRPAGRTALGPLMPTRPVGCARLVCRGPGSARARAPRVPPTVSSPSPPVHRRLRRLQVTGLASAWRVGNLRYNRLEVCPPPPRRWSIGATRPASRPARALPCHSFIQPGLGRRSAARRSGSTSTPNPGPAGTRNAPFSGSSGVRRREAARNCGPLSAAGVARS